MKSGQFIGTRNNVTPLLTEKPNYYNLNYRFTYAISVTAMMARWNDYMARCDQSY